MRALTISGHGGLEQLQLRDDLPAPELESRTDVRIRVRAAALNHIDLFVLAGLPNSEVVAPWTVASDACGVVESIGDDVRSVGVGDLVVVNPGLSDRTCAFCQAGDHPLCLKFRILGENVPGTATELLVLPEANVRVIPPQTDPAVAAAFPLATLTAWRMVHTRARVQRGERVLIWGIGGGVAIAALQICKQIGAEVWVTSRSQSKLSRAKELGADHVIETAPDTGVAVRKATGKAGVHVVLDNVGRSTWPQSLVALGRAGRLVTCGATSGPIVETDVRRLFWNQWSLMGSTMGNDAEFDAIVAELKAGRLLPPVDSVWRLDQGRDAYARLDAAEQFGKVVFVIDS